MLWRDALKGGHPSPSILGLSYYAGSDDDTPRDYTKASLFFNLAAQNGDWNGNYYLGIMYFNGQGTNQNYAESAKQYELAAQEGHSVALYNLGCMYHNGEGVQLNDFKAIKYFKSASEKGFPNADRALTDILSISIEEDLMK